MVLKERLIYMRDKMRSLGLKRETGQLKPHDKQWDEISAQTIKTLKLILSDDAIDDNEIVGFLL